MILSFGKPFIYERNEFNNSKSNNSNSYNSSLDINGINWQDKIDNLDTFTYVKELIELRKKLAVFDLYKSEDIKKVLTFVDGLEDFLIAYRINFKNKKIYLVFNALKNDYELDDITRNKIFNEERELVKIFNKKGKINKRLNVSDIKKISKYSVNVYVGGKYYGL